MEEKEAVIYLTIPSVEDIICNYFRANGNVVVSANISCGKQVTGKDYIPHTGVVSIDVRKTEFEGDREFHTPLPVDIDDIKRMIAEKYERFGLNVTAIDFTVREDDPTALTGFKVTTVEKKIEGKSL